MIEILQQVGYETLGFFHEMAAYLVFGLLIAAVLHVFFPEAWVRRHLGNNSTGSVLKATLFGIPLPVCSCGVVPVAASLRNSGASRGATVSFLIATPQIGADSFLITYSLLGWVFGVFRIIAAFITALVAGLLVNGFSRRDPDHKITQLIENSQETALSRLKTLPHYLIIELLGPIANMLLLGTVLAGIISALIPQGFLESSTFSGNLTSMIAMLAISVPLYVCASASTPIAAALVLKGLSPGAALVFLLAGPATNAMTLAIVPKIVGKTAAIIYVLSICVVSLALGGLLNVLTDYYGFPSIISAHQHDILPDYLKWAGTISLTAMLIGYYISVFFFTPKVTTQMSNQMTLNVDGMTCMHCVANVKKAVEAVAGANANVQIDLATKSVGFELADPAQLAAVKTQITAAGYEVL
ncbi:MAG: hypothetical protein RIT27_1838 [Pseudomonadota bacterium]|jgi:uncharacterized membrane protein YraQ (UPF0718 family)/copper chaperone CopZ